MNELEEACPHPASEHQVRIACHEDMLSAACRSAATLSQWVCGRPQCKARAMAQTKALTGFDPVTIRREAARV